LDEAKIHFEGTNSKFILALGNPIFRKIVADKLICIGGVLSSVVSKTAIIGRHEVKLGEGLNIMHHVMISNSVQIGTGTLINAFSSIHHDVVIGNYCEVSPHAVLLGGCTVGNYTSIGANATILPNIKVGSNVVVGSGSVVTKDVPDNRLIVGVPAVIKKELKPFV
jgi:sugar O-acyltransferase (sialic acid O-acetyltransferase NeuD family)